MKNLYNINKIAFIITLVLYISVFYGMLFQILLGAIQILSGLYLCFQWKKLFSKQKKHLTIYWAFVGCYSIGWIFSLSEWNSYNEFIYVIIGIMVIPMAIAAYFLFILHSVKNQYK